MVYGSINAREILGAVTTELFSGRQNLYVFEQFFVVVMPWTVN